MCRFPGTAGQWERMKVVSHLEQQPLGLVKHSSKSSRTCNSCAAAAVHLIGVRPGFVLL